MDNTQGLRHFDNVYFDEPLRFGDVRLVQIGHRRCTDGEVIAAHPHLNWFELTVVTSGGGTVVTNGCASRVRSGDTYLSLPCEVHEIRADRGDDLEYSFLSFFSVGGDTHEELRRLTRDCAREDGRIFFDERVSSLVKSALYEFSEEPKRDAERALTDIFHLMIIYILRIFGEEGKSAERSEAELLSAKIMNYVDTHIYSLRSLDTVGEKFGYSYGYISTLFKRTVGITLFEYWYNRKMESARALLNEGKKSVGEIAEMLGYNLYSFSKAFKARYGVSPKNMQIASGKN